MCFKGENVVEELAFLLTTIHLLINGACWLFLYWPRGWKYGGQNWKMISYKNCTFLYVTLSNITKVKNNKKIQTGQVLPPLHRMWTKFPILITAFFEEIKKLYYKRNPNYYRILKITRKHDVYFNWLDYSSSSLI